LEIRSDCARDAHGRNGQNPFAAAEGSKNTAQGWLAFIGRLPNHAPFVSRKSQAVNDFVCAVDRETESATIEMVLVSMT
jgi:hypothetical protein